MNLIQFYCYHVSDVLSFLHFQREIFRAENPGGGGGSGGGSGGGIPEVGSARLAGYSQVRRPCATAAFRNVEMKKITLSNGSALVLRIVVF